MDNHKRIYRIYKEEALSIYSGRTLGAGRGATLPDYTKVPSKCSTWLACGLADVSNEAQQSWMHSRPDH